MARGNIAAAGLAVVAWLLTTGAAAQTCVTASARFQAKMGSGYKVAPIATGITGARHIVVDKAGNLLVATSGGAVRRLVLQDNGDTVCMVSNTAISGAQGSTNHGIDLSADGKTLFTSNLASVTAFPYDDKAGTVGTGKVIISGMSNTGTHPTRAILVSKSSPDTILVARGSNNNIDTTTLQESTGRSIIRAFSISKASQTPIDYASGGETLGWGLRNIVGMGEDPVYGGIWSVENSLDNMKVGGRDVHNDNPAEKLNYHGVLNETANQYKGANFGYPSCFPIWDPALGTVGSLIQPDDVPAASDCAKRQRGRLNFHAHTAPLDIKFNANATHAYVAFHGSWNRNPSDGYRVMRVDFKNGEPVESATSRTAQIPVMENLDATSCRNTCFRPVGLAFDAKGRLFVSSDTTGEIFVVYGA